MVTWLEPFSAGLRPQTLCVMCSQAETPGKVSPGPEGPDDHAGDHQERPGAGVAGHRCSHRGAARAARQRALRLPAMAGRVSRTLTAASASPAQVVPAGKQIAISQKLKNTG